MLPYVIVANSSPTVNINRLDPEAYNAPGIPVALADIFRTIRESDDNIVPSASSSDGTNGISLVSSSTALTNVPMDLRPFSLAACYMEVVVTSFGSPGVLQFELEYYAGNVATPRSYTFNADLSNVTNARIYLLPLVKKSTRYVFNPFIITPQFNFNNATPVNVGPTPARSLKLKWNSTSTNYAATLYPVNQFDSKSMTDFTDTLSQFAR